MKAFRIIIFALLAALSVSAYAQQNESSASVVRRAREDAKKANAKKNGNISDRMQSFYEAKEKRTPTLASSTPKSPIRTAKASSTSLCVCSSMAKSMPTNISTAAKCLPTNIK